MKKKFKAKPQGRKPFSQPVANGNGNGSQGSNRRGVRGVMNQKTPDAQIYSAPMDLSLIHIWTQPPCRQRRERTQAPPRASQRNRSRPAGCPTGRKPGG